MNQNQKTIARFYTAFQQSDGAAMAACYHPEIVFLDPVFPLLHGKRAMAMWAFLTQRPADPKDRTFGNIEADDDKGSAHWEAKYIFPQTGRRVHNKIDARFEFKDGKIIKHVDTFNFWKWSAMALGPIGLLLGWTGFLKSKVRKQVQAKLDEFIASNASFSS